MTRNRRVSLVASLSVGLLASCNLLPGSSSGPVGPRPQGGGTWDSGSSSVSSGEDGTASGSSSSAHDKMVVLNMKLGMPVEGHAGFTCFDQRETESGSRTDTYCVKFLDDRCKGKPISINAGNYRDDKGTGCHYGFSGRATWFEGTLMQTANTGDTSDPRRRNPKKPLSSILLIGTKSTPSKIWNMYYIFPFDDLTDDSKLTAALVQKYGTPVKKNPPHEMDWALDNVELEVECDEFRGCMLDVEDRKFEEMENRRQEESDARGRRQNAPTPQL